MNIISFSKFLRDDPSISDIEVTLIDREKDQHEVTYAGETGSTLKAQIMGESHRIVEVNGEPTHGNPAYPGARGHLF